MTTFSQLVDRIANEIVRPDMINMLPAYLNQTIREVHANAQTNMPVFFSENRKEELLTVDALTDETGAFVWSLTLPALLQKIEAVWYGRIGRYVYEGNPRTALNTNPFNPNAEYFYYRVGTNLVFAKAGGVGDKIRLSYFLFPRSLVYYEASARPAYWDNENQQFMIKAGQIPATAFDLTTNWILQKHEEMLAEGLRAKAYKRMDDAARARMCYSQYESMRLSMQNTESLNVDSIVNN